MTKATNTVKSGFYRRKLICHSEDLRDEESLPNVVGGTVIYREAVRKCLL